MYNKYKIRIVELGVFWSTGSILNLGFLASEKWCTETKSDAWLRWDSNEKYREVRIEHMKIIGKRISHLWILWI